MKTEMQLSGFGEMLNLLHDLPPEVVSSKGGPVKAALKKGAQVILKQEKINLQAVTSNATSTGKRESTGLLLKSLIASRGKAPSGGKGERYLVRVKKRIYADANGKTVTTLQTAQLLEYGSSHQPMEPFIRPAFETKAKEAILTVEKEFISQMVKIVKALAKQRSAPKP